MFLYRHRRRRLGSPLVGPTNAALKRLKLATVNLSLGRLFHLLIDAINSGMTRWRLTVVIVVLIQTFSVLSLQLKKLWRHNKSAIDLSNANPACGHKEIRRSTVHNMVTTRYSDQQGSKSRQNPCRVQPTEKIGNSSASRRSF